VFTQIHADTFPFVYPRFSLVVNFDIDTAGSHMLTTDIIDPAGNRIGHSEMPVTTHIGNWQVVANFEQMQYPVPGTYTFRLALDGVALGERSLAVLPTMSPVHRKPNIA
jgi:hypothetical protein